MPMSAGAAAARIAPLVPATSDAGARSSDAALSSRSGAPLGLSIMGPAGSDLSLVALARRIADGAST